MGMRFDYYTRLKEGEEFEKYWCEVIKRKICLNLTRVCSRENQTKNLCDTQEGFEFKYDKKMVETGNLWIEVAQKMEPSDSEEDYMPSSLKRKDNSWMYCIGDYTILFFIPKRTLLNAYESGKWEVIENNTKTSKGFLISKLQAQMFSVLELSPLSKEENLKCV